MSHSLSFTKMHGIGNDYIYFDCRFWQLPEPAKVARVLSDRHRGIGADGIILIEQSAVADVRMRMFNADGSESSMCGNGIRCVGKFVFDKGIVTQNAITVETKAGIKELSLTVASGKVSRVQVDMGEPILYPTQIPVDCHGEMVVAKVIVPELTPLACTCVSMGNPHAVFFVPQITDEHVHHLGPQIENHRLFPARVNVEFATVLSRSQILMRVWERGTGETQACGTGACAVVVAGVLNGLSDRTASVQLLGGKLEISWDADNHVYMEGPAETVFEGVIDLDLLGYKREA